jgi:hypothetical protein
MVLVSDALVVFSSYFAIDFEAQLKSTMPTTIGKAEKQFNGKTVRYANPTLYHLINFRFLIHSQWSFSDIFHHLLNT